MKAPAKLAASQFKRAFLARTAQARTRAKLTQTEIALILQIPQDQYKQYEKRSPLPHYLVASFCLTTKVDPGWLFGMPTQKAVESPIKPARNHSPKS